MSEQRHMDISAHQETYQSFIKFATFGSIAVTAILSILAASLL